MECTPCIIVELFKDNRDRLRKHYEREGINVEVDFDLMFEILAVKPKIPVAQIVESRNEQEVIKFFTKEMLTERIICIKKDEEWCIVIPDGTVSTVIQFNDIITCDRMKYFAITDCLRHKIKNGVSVSMYVYERVEMTESIFL